ncbi:MAG TPA: glutamine amidotransferase [bacterium]|nr:glutamine amidotransferase [bacterium]HQQ00418.1 glutamine amidotransferase [bacterium]
MNHFHLQFFRPWMLLFLLLLPWLIASMRSVRVLGRGRKTVVLALRLIGFVLLVGAIAETQLLRKDDRLAVMFLIDRSSSIPETERLFAESYLAQQIQLQPPEDLAGLIFFGKQAAIESVPVRDLASGPYRTVVDTEATDIEQAIRLALAAFPQNTQKRIVLLSDGNQTQGDAETAGERAKANRVEVSVLPLHYKYENETILQEMAAPSQVRQDEPFRLSVVVNAQKAGPATLRLFQQQNLVLEQAVELNEGKNVFVIPQQMKEGGMYRYEAVVEPEQDSRGINNRGEGFVVISGVGKVLYLEGRPEEGVNLQTALNQEGIPVDLRSPAEAPHALYEYNMYDLIILSDVNAADLSLDQQRMIQSAVRDFGVGLLMIGGEDSFGCGGYLGTPVEEALPVTMEIQQRKVIPSGALVLIMHTCEMPEGNYWAKEISLAALNALSSNDYMGFLRYSNMGRESWLFPLHKLGQKSEPLRLLRNLGGADVGDMPDFDTTLRMAYDALINCPANLKHIVLMSDGDPARPDIALINRIRAAEITISTVCFNAHPNNLEHVQLMKELAQAGGGNAYLVQNGAELPSIFIKEAAQVTRSLIVEEPFTPRIAHPSEVIDGFSEGFPQLLGYVLTTLRPESQMVLTTEQQDPVLALRRYGVGKSAAFTSDAKARWAQSWIAWNRYAQFWSQVARWTMRDPGDSFCQIDSRVDGDWVRVAIDAVDEEGHFLNNLKMTANAMSPQLDRVEFDIQQTAPGRYEGRFPADRAGSYMMSIGVEGEGRQSHIWTGASIPTSPEQRFIRSNDSFLQRLAQIGGGKVLDAKSPVFEHNLESYTQQIPLWPYLLALSILLFCLDICARRLFFEVAQFQRAAKKAVIWAVSPFRKIALPERPATEEMGQLMEAKRRAESFHGAPITDEERKSLTAEKETFLASLDETKVEPTQEERPTAKPQPTVRIEEKVPADQAEKSPATGYTGSLLEAKRRAQERIQKKEN